MTLRVGNERHDEHGNGYFPIVRDGAIEESVGTAYTRETAALFAAAPELLTFCERLSEYIETRGKLFYPGVDVCLLPDAVKFLKSAIQKAKGGRS